MVKDILLCLSPLSQIKPCEKGPYSTYGTQINDLKSYAGNEGQNQAAHSNLCIRSSLKELMHSIYCNDRDNTYQTARICRLI